MSLSCNLVRKDCAVIANPLEMFNYYQGQYIIATVDLKVVQVANAAYNQPILSDNYFLSCSRENLSQQIR